MFREKYNQIMERDEEHRNKWALGLAASLSVIIFISFAFYEGYINFGDGGEVAQARSLETASAASAPSPFENSKEALSGFLGKAVLQYQAFKESVANVMAPFIEGIEVYERE